MKGEKGKVPGYFYYPLDFERDLKGHGLEIRGAVQTIMNTTFWTEGELSLPLLMWARILEVDEAGAQRVFDHIKEHNLCDISVTSNKNVTVRSRRMYRDAKAKKNSRIRQAEHRKRLACHTEVTPPSSTSSSISTSKKDSRGGRKTQPDVLTTDQLSTLYDHFLGHDKTGIVDPSDQKDLALVFDMIFRGWSPRGRLAYLKQLAAFDLGQVVWAAGDFMQKKKYERDTKYSPATLFKLCVEADDGGFQARLQRQEIANETVGRSERSADDPTPADDRSGTSGANSVGDVLRDMPEVRRVSDCESDVPTEESDT